MLSRIVRGVGRRAMKFVRARRKDPAQRAITDDFVRSSYRVLLHREVDSRFAAEGVVANDTSEAEQVLRILRSAEFARGTVATRLAAENWQPQDGQCAARLAAMLESFKIYAGSGQPGFYMNFLGARTRTRYVAGTHLYDSQVLPPPIET